MSAGQQSYDVRFWKIEKRVSPALRYRVRWTVNRRRFGRTFLTLELAESFRAQLKSTASRGEGFDLEAGLPQSLLRHALRKALNQNDHAREPDVDERRALGWLDRASLPVSALSDSDRICDMLDILARCLDGTAAAPDYFARRRRVMHRSWPLRCARSGSTKPAEQGQLPEGWSPPEKAEEAVDPRSAGDPELVAHLLVVASYVGRRQGPRFVAFFGCMFYAMMRPAEVISLAKDGCVLPKTGWGRLVFSDSSPAAGRDFTDDGRVHDERGLKGRDRQASARVRSVRARRATRSVPIPPLREHIRQFGTDPDGHLFRSENGIRSSHPPTGGSGRSCARRRRPRSSRLR